MSFYDEHCGDEYLTKESTISYRPSALTLLDGLIGVCDSARSEIADRIKSNESTALRLNIPPTTAAGTFLATLTASTTEAQVDAATALPVGTNERLASVLQEEVRLASSNPQSEKTRLTTLAKQVNGLAQDLNQLLTALNTESINSLAEFRSDATSARIAASIAAVNSFDDEPLAGVGSETWRTLWNAARAYSTTGCPGHDFPVVSDGSVCVLCQQTLDDNGKDRLRRFEQYMAN